MKTTLKFLSLAVLGGAFLAPAAYAQKTIKIGYAVSRDSHYGAGADAFCSEIEKRTAARYKCSQAPNATLGNEREMVEAAQIGSLDIAFVSSGTVGNFVPDIRVLDIPFLFRDYAHARNTLDGEIGQKLLAQFPSKGLVALAWGENGFRQLTTSRRAINKPADLASVKLRTMENKVHIESFKTLGALPTPMAWPEVYTALQQGTIDGQENPLPILATARLWQVQKYLALTSHIYSPTLFLASPAMYGKLSDEDKKSFLAAAKIGAEAQRARVTKEDQSVIAQAEKEGMTVTRPNTAEFRTALEPAFKEFEKTYGPTLKAIAAVK
ncbi:MAG: DctP family TRAP transporter solute-binding subunit [Comamonadaceae bacterium]|nr:MAG: DctP family TRAP transporter solute-binding subunit [Comamonadaceae bacterium]